VTVPSSVVQVTTTAPTEADARRVADALLAERVAACVQVDGPITSRYRWEGAVTEATEWRCVAKTTAGAAERAVAAVVAAHPYDVPEVLVTTVDGGHQAYLDWVADEVS
jgi:periplasmic divalent cation tolerance protein